MHIAASFPTQCYVCMVGKQTPAGIGICPASPVMPQESLYTCGLSLRNDVWDGALIHSALQPDCCSLQHHDVISILWPQYLLQAGLCFGCPLSPFLWKGAMRDPIYNPWATLSLSTGQSVPPRITAEELLLVACLLIQKSVPDSQAA